MKIQNDYSNPPQVRTAEFGSVKCTFTSLYPLKEKNKHKIYYYRHYVPLDAKKIQCNSYNISVPKDENITIKISNFIKADFDIKNVEVSITDKSHYFTFNGKRLAINDKFPVTKDVYFKYKDSKKLHIPIRSYGKIISNSKDCEFYIMICNERCSNCDPNKDPSENDHQCLTCRNGYYPSPIP